MKRPSISDTARSIFAEMAGSPMSGWVGGGDPMEKGITHREIVKRLTGAEPDRRILDFGCGIGRTAAAFLSDPEFYGNIIGVDIVPDMVAFCKRVLGNNYANVEFYCTDVKNLQYDRYKSDSLNTIGENELFAKLVQVIDTVVAFSVFTHLDEISAVNTLHLLRGALKPTGSLVMSGFILDRESRAAIREERARVVLPRAPADQDDFYATDDLSLVAISRQKIDDLAISAGFRIETMLTGNWRGYPSSMGLTFFQDVLCLRPLPTLPEGFDPTQYLTLHSDLRAAGVDARQHYLRYGFYEGRIWR